MLLHYDTDREAVFAMLASKEIEGACVLICREMGAYFRGYLHERPLPVEDARREKHDRIFVLADGAVQTQQQCSTWPFHDRQPPTKVVSPVFAKAGLCIGTHGSEKRPALVDQGFHFFDGDWFDPYTGMWEGQHGRITGFHVHSDKGNSEACITTAGQDEIDALIKALRLHRGRKKHADGRQCYDTVIVHVRRCVVGRRR